jgi:nucleotide-binding universal stress UspA family protein
MPIKDLLVTIDRSPASDQRLGLVLTMAAKFSARVTALTLVPEPYLPALVGVHFPVELLREQAAEAEREADGALAAAGEAAQRLDITLATRRITGPIDRLPILFAQAARHADLCVVGQPNEENLELPTTLLAESAFMDTGRPALVVPYIGAPATLARRVLVAWNGSREATRAVHDALPFLTAAERTTVLVVDPALQGSPVGDAPGADIAAHLARHGVRVELKTSPSAGMAVGDVILALVADEGTDLLVMGGYGHSRLRELVLGGATRQILAQMTVPVLLSH